MVTLSIIWLFGNLSDKTTSFRSCVCSILSQDSLLFVRDRCLYSIVLLWTSPKWLVLPIVHSNMLTVCLRYSAFSSDAGFHWTLKVRFSGLITIPTITELVSSTWLMSTSMIISMYSTLDPWYTPTPHSQCHHITLPHSLIRNGYYVE